MGPLGVEFDDRVRELRVSFVQSLRELAMRFQGSAARLETAREPEVTQIERARMRDIAHRLSGSGALFGLDQITAWGRATEKLAQHGSIPALRRAGADLVELVAGLR